MISYNEILEGRSSVVMTDFSDYDSEQCHDGGRYWIATTYKRLGESVIAEHSNSSIFPTCRRCGDMFEWSIDRDRHEDDCMPVEIDADEFASSIEDAVKRGWEVKIV